MTLMLLLLLPGCRVWEGGGPEEMGNGSGTMDIFGDAYFDGSDTTRVDFNLYRSGVPLQDARVRIFPDYLPPVDMTEGNAGFYFADLPGYDQGYEFSCAWSADWVEWRAYGPDVPTLTEPLPYQEVDVDTGELVVRWTGAGEFVQVVVGPYDSGEIADTGELVIPGAELTAGEYLVELKRWTTVELAGSFAASTFSIALGVDSEAPVNITSSAE